MSQPVIVIRLVLTAALLAPVLLPRAAAETGESSRTQEDYPAIFTPTAQVDPGCVARLSAIPSQTPSSVETLALPSGSTLSYRMFPPPTVEKNTRYPVVLILHHGGVRGRYHLLFKPTPPGHPYGIGYFLEPERRARYPAFLFLPSSDNQDWHGSALNKAIEGLQVLMHQLPVDDNRVYVIGQSMGGAGVWKAVQRHPQLFAAGIAVGSNEVSPTFVEDGSPPVWAFLNSDPRHPETAPSREPVEQVQRAGARIRLYEYQNASHEDCSQLAFCREDLARWLFAHSRSS